MPETRKNLTTLRTSRVQNERTEFDNNVIAGAGGALPFPSERCRTVVPLPPELAKRAREGTVDLLTIHGSSLEGIGIYDGDQVLCAVVRSVKEIKPDAICIVRILATADILAKKVILRNGKITLRSFNSGVKDILVEPEDIEVQGIILKVLRGPDPYGHFDRNYNSEIPY